MLRVLKEQGEAPQWLTEDGYKTLCGGYMLAEETPRAMYRRVAKAAASYLKDSLRWECKFFDIMWRNWLCPASPVLSNMGTERGLPVSCNLIHCDDSVNDIFTKVHELAMLSKNGAGVGVYLGDVRGRGAPIKGNGVSEGVIPWAKVFDATTVAVSQGSSRRGASALYLPVEHLDAAEFINIRRPVGDINRRCLNINNGLCISDRWMESMLAGDHEKQELWREILNARVSTGEPYLFFTDTVNEANPEVYKDKGLSVKSSNLCTEIMLHTDKDTTFVCCLSSMNLTKWDEWADTDAVETAVRFLDCVLEEYIRKIKDLEGFGNAYRGASEGRPVGLGVLGWHTLLQMKGIAFDSFDAMTLNNKVFKVMRQKADFGTQQLAKELGEPPMLVGYGRRNSHTLAVAPTVSNSLISGGHSAGIEPLSDNYFMQPSAKGTFVRKNPQLVAVLSELGQDTPEVWKSILKAKGSVQHLDFLDQQTKEVFKTAREINQMAIVNQAAQRQKYIDQGQSVNLFFAGNDDPQYVHDVHVAAWSQGLKSLYYLRSEGVLQGDVASRDTSCKACEG